MTERSGYFIEGARRWGEFSPLPSWDSERRELALLAAIEQADAEYPKPVRGLVDVNVLVPRVNPQDHELISRLASHGGCKTVKVKVGDVDGVDRVAMIRLGLGPEVRIRLDANGAYRNAAEAKDALSKFVPYDIELVEDPVSDPGELKALRGTVPFPVAAEQTIRSEADARVARETADVLVIKPQRIGGCTRSLEIADAFGGPVIASCALETSIGLQAVLAVAAALPNAPYAHGIGTAHLFADEPVDESLTPVDGKLPALTRPRKPR